MSRQRKRWLTSDLHLGHSNIIEFMAATRGEFDTIEQHDDCLITLWNERVHPDDKVYVVGDFSLTRDDDVLESYVKRLHGNKSIVLGNHDQCSPMAYARLFRRVEGSMELGKDNMILTHIPVRPNSIAPRYSMNLHGHTHSEGRVKRTHYVDNQNEVHESIYVHVGVDAWCMRPVDLDEIKSINAQIPQ